MADEQDIQVELDLAATEPEAQQVETQVERDDQVSAAPAKPEAEDPISALQKQYNELKAQDEARARALEDSNRREAEARAQAEHAAREAAEARSQVADTSLQSVDSRLAAADAEIASAKKDLAAFMSAADYDKAADAQAKLSEATARKVGLERDKKALEDSRQQRPPQRVVVNQPQSTDPFERALQQFSPSAQQWLRKHPECVTDPAKYQRMVSSHHVAVADGIEPDTPQYFEAIDRRMGYLVDQQQSSQQQQQTQQRPRSMPAAPPSRDASSTPGSKVSVQLTAGEVKAATDGTLVYNSGPNKGKPIGVQEMARRKALLSRDGKYSNISIN